VLFLAELKQRQKGKNTAGYYLPAVYKLFFIEATNGSVLTLIICFIY